MKVNILRERPITAFQDLIIKGVAWTVVNQTPDAYEIRMNEDPHLTDFIPRKELGPLIEKKEIRIVDKPDLVSAGQPTVTSMKVALVRVTWLHALDRYVEAQFKVNPRTRVTEAFVKSFIADKKSAVLEEIYQVFRESGFDHAAPRKKKRFGSLSDDRDDQNIDYHQDRVEWSARRLKEKYDEWVANDRDFDHLLPNWGHQSGGGRQVDPRTLKFIYNNIEKFAMEKRTTISKIVRKINSKITIANAAIAQELRVPDATRYSVNAALDTLPASAKIGLRHGKKKMHDVLGRIGRGPQYHRIGEMVLFDCWSTHVHLLIPEHCHHLFTEDERATRITIAAGLDSATGCVVALVGGVTETTDLVRRALRMAVSDKTEVAKAAGCRAPWNTTSGIEGAKSDAGGAYRNRLYLSSALILADRVTITAAKQARLRGMLERLWLNIDEDFIRSCLTGGTFSNVEAKGEYKPQERATVFIDKFMRMLIRWTVDIYHYSVWDKKKLAPARRFEDIAGRMEFKEIPSTDLLRLAFGVTLTRKLTRAGIRFMNVNYYSPWLDELLRDRGPHDVQIKVDEDDIGRISVFVNQRWLTAVGPVVMDGLALRPWLEQNAALARRHGELARVDFAKYVAPAVLDLDMQAYEAERAFNLQDAYLTAEVMDQLENELRVFVVYDREPVGEETALTSRSDLLGAVRKRSFAAGLSAVRDVSPSEPSTSSAAMALSQKTPAEPPIVRTRSKRNR